MAASPVGAVTIDQLLKAPAFISGVRSHIGETGNFFQKLFNITPETQSQQPVPPGQDVVGWDFFDNTRTMSEIRGNLSGPARVIPQKAGTATGVLLRSYESSLFELNRIAGYRPMGKPIGTLTKAGEDYIARQTKFLLQKQYNSREFALSRVFRGGFDIKFQAGDRMTLQESGSGTISIDTKIPSNHKSQIALGVSSANIIDATWATASTDVIKQFHLLRQVAERESGLPVHHGIIASQNYINLINNDKLRAAGGSAFRVWEQMQTNRMQTMTGFRERGDDVTFRALPQCTFHVYDGVLNVDQDRDSSSEADCSLFVPTDKCIFTPDPGDWIGQAVGQEYVQKNWMEQETIVTGSANWVRKEIDPTPGRDLRTWAKWLPILYIPKAVYYATVVF